MRYIHKYCLALKATVDLKDPAKIVVMITFEITTLHYVEITVKSA